MRDGYESSVSSHYPSQKKKQADPERNAEIAAQGMQDATPDNVMDSPEKLLGEEFPFEEHLFDEPRSTKLHMSRSEKGEHNLKWAKG